MPDFVASRDAQAFQLNQLYGKEGGTLLPDYIPGDGTSTRSRDCVPFDSLVRAYRIHNEGSGRYEWLGRNEVRVDVGLEDVPVVEVTVSIIDLDPENPNKPTIFVMGGGVSSVDALKVIGLPLAAMGCRVIMVPHPMNKDVSVSIEKRENFVEWFYRYDQQYGAFTPDGLILAQVVKQLAEEDRITNTAAVVGVSAGVPVLLRTLDELQRDHVDANIFNRFNAIFCLNPAGAIPGFLTTEDDRGRFLRSLGKGFATESISAFFDRDEWMLNMGDAGSGGWDFRDLAKQGKRCISDVMSMTAPRLDIPMVVLYGTRDRAVQPDILSITLRDIAEKRRTLFGDPRLQMIGINGTHAWPVQNGMRVAVSINRTMQEMLKCG